MSRTDSYVRRRADISSELRSLSMELQHEVNWTAYKTVNNAIAGTTQYPSGFKFGNKTLAGNITRYLTDTNDSTVQSFGLGKALRIKAGTTIAGTFFGVDLNTTNCTFTNRAQRRRCFYAKRGLENGSRYWRQHCLCTNLHNTILKRKK